ncbi:hypothetical protein K503DRAFT_798598 [Rhizopogon vinicolor AM-OR11-026]|uniref:Uncharacterized protein n=1 Tax=Rhizopogon vinicolor AM-OR11-026 TaxID=1314800 RepID=A0A1B7N751_9AGAM|nr:hypothetical protein K503DRAFT_798598 [Rhizopogon vinicolor AM-OR11-026]
MSNHQIALAPPSPHFESEEGNFSGYSDKELSSIYEDSLEITPTQQPVEVKPSETQRGLHVKSCLRDPAISAPRAFPIHAIGLLHKYEAFGFPAPVKSYTRVTPSLFSVRPAPSSPSTSSTPQIPLGRVAAHAQAWDLFAHVRYVAHPTPDAHL